VRKKFGGNELFIGKISREHKRDEAACPAASGKSLEYEVFAIGEDE